MGGQRGKGGGKKGGNPGVGIDFKKAKHKVGKRLPKAQNETDTNFKARSINLPSQAAITEEKTGIAVNSQNHTLKAGGMYIHHAAAMCLHASLHETGVKSPTTNHCLLASLKIQSMHTPPWILPCTYLL